MVNRTLGEGAVTYYRIQIPSINGMTFKFNIDDGRVLVCGSRTNPNPDCRDSNTYDWLCETDNYCDVHIESMATSRKRQADADIMFVAIEGVEESNEVVMETVMGDDSVSNGMSIIIMLVLYIVYQKFVYSRIQEGSMLQKVLLKGLSNY